MSEFYRVQDSKISQKDFVDEYKTTWTSGQVDNAQAMINDTESEELTLNSNKLNPQIDSIKTLEQYWFDGVINKIGVNGEYTQDYQSWIDNLLVTREEWDSGVQYYKNNIVIYNGQACMALSDPPIGVNPDDTTYWVAFTIKGGDGYPTLGINFYSQPWDVNISYSIQVIDGANYYPALVYGSGQHKYLYVAKVDIEANQLPPDQNSNWVACLDIYTEKIDYMTTIGEIPQEIGDVFILGNINNNFVQFYQVNGISSAPITQDATLVFESADDEYLATFTAITEDIPNILQIDSSSGVLELPLTYGTSSFFYVAGEESGFYGYLIKTSNEYSLQLYIQPSVDVPIPPDLSGATGRVIKKGYDLNPLDITTNMSYVDFNPVNLITYPYGINKRGVCTETDTVITKAIQKIYSYFNLN